MQRSTNMLHSVLHWLYGDDLMSDTCECYQPGFCERRGCVLSGLHFKRCQGGEVAMLDKLYADRLPPVIPTTDNRLEVERGNPMGLAVGNLNDTREPVGTALKTRIEKLITVKGTGCGCQDLATQMDSWGITGCEQRREEIITHLVNNREVLVESLRTHGTLGHAAGLVAEFIPDIMLRLGAGLMLDQAIADVRLEKTQRLHTRILRGGTSASNNAFNTKQKQIYNSIQWTPPTPDPFISTPIIHFAAHLWPVRGNWEWHAARWNEVAATINGRCIVGVVTDSTTATLDDVRRALSDKFELFEEPNTAQGENPTFRRIQTMIPQGQDDVIVYCHGKGVRSHTFDSEAVRIWTEMMYEAVVFNHAQIIQKLSDGYKCFGAFRTFGSIPLNPQNKWHYSGTFFAVRAKHIGTKEVKTGYGGVEAWPGDHFLPQESWCEFADAPDFGFGYNLDAITNRIPSQFQWEVDRIGGSRCEQHQRELDWFLEWLNPTDRILVIGSKHGGLEAAIKRRLPDVQTVSIDIDPQPDNISADMCVGSSHDADVQAAAVSLGPYDVVFIDGDHSYDGVKLDWEFAQTLNPKRLIAFHDIGDLRHHRMHECEVDRLWNEIKASGKKTDEKIVGAGWGGIGVVSM